MENHRIALNNTTSARQKKQCCARPRHIWPKIDPVVDKTGENAYNLFVEHYRDKSLPIGSEDTLKLFEERYMKGSYDLPPEGDAPLTRRAIFRENAKARERFRHPLVKTHMDQLHQASSKTGSTGLDALHKYKNHLDGGDQSGGSGSGSGNNHLYTATPKSPSGDVRVYAPFDLNYPPPPDFEGP